MHQDTVTTHTKKPNCTRCGYNHPKGSCPASGQQCYNCSGFGHYTALCKKPRTRKQYNCPSRPTSRRPSCRYSSRSATRGNSKSHSPFRTIHHIPLKLRLHKTSNHHNTLEALKPMLFKTNQHKILQTTPSKTIPYKTIHSNRTPLETMHYRTILLQKMSEIFFH